jgi:hypothetical protein
MLASAIDGIVISQENVREIPRALAQSSTIVWKTYLWGGPRDHALVSHLQETFSSLESVADGRGWIRGQGFQVSGGDQNDASEILGLPVLDTNSVEPLFVRQDSLDVVTESVMHRPRDPRIYRAPHVVLRKGFSDYPVSAFVDFDVAFTDGLYGIAGPSTDANEMRVVAGLLNSSLARYWFFMTSSSWGVEREQIQSNEFLSLPVPKVIGLERREILAAVKMARSRQAGWLRRLDAAVFRVYGLRRAETDLIRDALRFRLDEYRSGPNSVAYNAPTDAEFASYARTLKSSLRAGSSIDWEVELVERSMGFVLVVILAAHPTTERSRSLSVADLMSGAGADQSWQSPSAVVQPSAIVLDGDAIYLVKPDERRCWTRSSARADAAEIYSAVLRGPAEH